MKCYFLIVLLLSIHYISTQPNQVVPRTRSFLALNKPVSPLFAQNPHAWVVTSLTLCIVMSYVICYFFIGPISPILMHTKPHEHAFGLVRKE